jgi:hypothetical protein
VHIIRIILGGVFDRYPKLQIVRQNCLRSRRPNTDLATVAAAGWVVERPVVGHAASFRYCPAAIWTTLTATRITAPTR